MWCCPTGPFTFLPIHAAGIYTENGISICDYAMISYTPTLNTLLRPTPQLTEDYKMAVIVQSLTGTQYALEHTTDELQRIVECAPQERMIKLIKSPTRPEDVTSALPQVSF